MKPGAWPESSSALTQSRLHRTLNLEQVRDTDSEKGTSGVCVMGASWLEIESLLKALADVTAFPHSEALMPVTRARDTVAEAAMIVSRAGISGDPREEAEAQIAMARARVTVH